MTSTELLIVRKLGFSTPVTAIKSTRCTHARAIFRDEKIPWESAYRISAVIIAGWYGG